jgi:hypothetical protein
MRVPAILTLILALVPLSCSSATDAGSRSTATIALLSGGNQTVTVNASGPGLHDLPEPVVVYVEDNGTPVVEGTVRVTVSMNGAPGPNGPYDFVTGADGRASMNLQVSNIVGPFKIDVSYVVCVTWGLFGCDRFGTRATVSSTGTAVL